MPRAMLEYTKEILKKVSFDTHLFSKELQKAKERLLPYELDELRDYIISLMYQNPSLKPCLVYLD
jgi:hypothetical protein